MRPSSPRPAAAIAAAGVAILLASSLAPPAGLFSLSDDGDIDVYFGYAQRTFEGEVPYRDIPIEYPPGFLPVLLAPATRHEAYYNRFRVLMLILAAATVVLLVVALYRVGADTAELAAAVFVLATLPRTLVSRLVFDHYDIWPAALVLLAVVGLLYGRRRIGLAALGVGAAAKVYPVALVPLALLARRGRAHVRRDLAVFAAAALVLALPFALVAPRGVARVGWLLVRRDLHVESLGGSILLAADQLGVYNATIFFSFGIGQSWDVAGPAAQVVTVVGSLAGAAALVTVWFLFARGPREPRDLLLAVAAAVVGFVAFGKVISPQYMVWVAAAVPLALGRVRLFALPATVVALLLTRSVYLDGYWDLLEAGRWSWVMLARNLILVAIFCSLVFKLAARGRARAATPVSVAATGESAPP